MAVLDGQQRLTSIYIGLTGSYAYRTPRKQWKNDAAFLERRLYLNIVGPAKNDTDKYEFSFLTEGEAENDNEHYWFAVGNILNMPELGDVMRYLMSNIVYSYSKEQAEFANNALGALYKAVHEQRSISYYKVKNEQLDTVLQIFIRVNSGGTILSYSDLLLSIASAQWKELDARKEITDFVDEINSIGYGFNVNKDFVLKASLVLSDFRDIAFKVDNFNKTNMLKIEQNWQTIIKSVALAQSCLPTETEYNDQWNKMDTPHDKLDKLDKLAHHGVIDDPSYYTCIQEQFAFFSKVVDKIEELFQKYHRVIITGDHGSSRLAARFFHAREGYPAPASSQVCSHGRFCIFNGAKIIASSNQVIAKDSDGNQYLIFKNYDHFKQSGFAAGGDDENAQYGELHGGASPEELLVPVIVFDSIHELPLTATWEKDSIKFSMKKAKPVILFNKPVQNVQASLGSVDGICTPIDTVGKEWMIVFSENKAEATKNFKYDPIIIADGKVVHVPSLEIKPALGGGDFDL